MNLIPIGVKSVKEGPVPDDGTMGTVLADIGPTYKGTVSLVEDAASVFNVMVEEQDDPIYQFFTKGTKKFAFSLPDYTPETIQRVKGGDVIDGTWMEPDNVPVIERSYQIITQTDVLFEIPRMGISAVINGKMQKDAVGLLDIVGTPLKPEGPGVKIIMISKYAKPTTSAGNAQNVAVNNANLVGTATAFRGDITDIAWSIDTKVVGSNPVFGTPDALNTTVNGLSVSGVYKFRLTVTDENGYSNSATVQVTVALA